MFRKPISESTYMHVHRPPDQKHQDTGYHDHRTWRRPGRHSGDEEGAFDFIQKPFNNQAVLDQVYKALEASVHLKEKEQTRFEILARVESLTPRKPDTCRHQSIPYLSDPSCIVINCGLARRVALTAVPDPKRSLEWFAVFPYHWCRHLPASALDDLTLDDLTYLRDPRMRYHPSGRGGAR